MCFVVTYQKTTAETEVGNRPSDLSESRSVNSKSRRPNHFNDKYNKGKLIGKTSFGQVYMCWLRSDAPDGNEESNRPPHPSKILQLKILKKNLLAHKPSQDDLLVNEFTVLTEAWDHPHIVRHYDLFQDRYNFYVITELLHGEDLYVTLGD